METHKDEESYIRDEESYNRYYNEEFIENQEFEKKLLRKIDLRIMPILTFSYLLSFLNRVNIGNAKLADIEACLVLLGTKFNWSLSIFFIGYVLSVIPSNLILIKTNPSMWIPFLMISWGFVMTLMAFAKDFSWLMTGRFFLSVFTSGVFPGAIYYMTTWYKRSEINARIAILFIGNSFADCISGILAYGIVSSLDGVLNLSGWQWIFLIEGLATVIFSIFVFFFLSDYPEKTIWLSDKERKYAVGRLKHDAGKVHAPYFDKKQIYPALKDWKVYLVILYMGAIGIPFFSYTLFIPTIINGMGYDSVQSQLFSVPPFVCAGIATTIVAILSDRKRICSPFIFTCSFIAIIGYTLLIIPSIGTAGKYAGVCIVGVGLYPASVTSLTWLANNITGHTKRGISTAIIMMSASTGGVLASQVYRNSDFPNYYVGHSIVLVFLVLATCISIIQYFAFKSLNKRKKENPQSFLEGKTEEEINDMGDLHPDFIYSL